MGNWTVQHETRWQKMAEQFEARGDGVARILIETVTLAGPKRSAAKNNQVLAIQRSYGRNPFFIGAAERRQLALMIKNSMAQFGLRGLERIARQLGEQILRFYREHIAAGRTSYGTMKPLEPSTLEAKKRKGTVGEPILVDTGELRDSLSFTVKKL